MISEHTLLINCFIGLTRKDPTFPSSLRELGYIDELRAEAIKWVKEMDINRPADYCDGMMDFIINFFNLTEEDFK